MKPALYYVIRAGTATGKGVYVTRLLYASRAQFFARRFETRAKAEAFVAAHEMGDTHRVVRVVAKAKEAS